MSVMISQNYSTQNPFEAKFGYSRAVRRGPFIFVSGTTSIDASTGDVLHSTSAYNQTILIFAEIFKAVESVGGRKQDIARVRMFVTHIEDADEVGQGLKESLGEILPAATMIIGARFVSSMMRVEIEADAVILQ
jgi:enamine deaminase RidA (YjgF/YER057c/UK114 family)